MERSQGEQERFNIFEDRTRGEREKQEKEERKSGLVGSQEERLSMDWGETAGETNRLNHITCTSVLLLIMNE